MSSNDLIQSTQKNSLIDKDIILKSDSNDEYINYNPNKPFDGIISKIKRIFLINTYYDNIIDIIASSTRANHPSKIIDYEWESHWVSENIPNQWIKFNFFKNQVFITHYEIKTYNYVTGGNHLKSWVFEASFNDHDWIELDKRQNSNDLNGKCFHQIFQCKKSGNYPYYRLKQIGFSHCDSNIMALTNIEFYGKLKLDPNL